jgi:hypothetical protein
MIIHCEIGILKVEQYFIGVYFFLIQLYQFELVVVKRNACSKNMVTDTIIEWNALRYIVLMLMLTFSGYVPQCA